MTAENTENPENPEHDGMDVLMAAILDEPLPAQALRDPGIMSAHGAAVADVVLLREQLALIGDALAGPAPQTEAGAATAGGEAATAAEAGAPAGRREAAPAGNRPGSGAGPAPGTAATPPAVTPPARPRAGRRTRRPLKVALGALAAAAAATVVVGTGWLVAQQPGGSSDDAGSKAAADSAAGEQDGGGVLFGSPRYLACARTVVEGTVSAVEPTPSGESERITLTVTRSYKTDDKKTELTFPIMTVGRPRLRAGDLVLVGIPLRDPFPDQVIVGEEGIAPERARIIASLPESRTLTCE
ncbi:hypothetical protein ACIHFC_01220 [Streptomyces sp. NPDC052013]|uniref:hypothetical protein n=1 Tax=Streptomyces sp. NPDC052013 TaxID=3365679 RepID=UPI0037D5D267